MKRRYVVNDSGLLEDREGNVLGRITSVTIETENVQFADESGGPIGGSVVEGGQQQLLTEEKPPTPSPAEPDKPRIVWDAYCEIMQPRSRDLDEQTRKVIRDALKVATVEELVEAIKGCHASPFHMGENERRKKYNKLSQILRGRQGKETTRERIDYFIDIRRQSGSTEMDSSVASVHRDRVVQRRLAVIESVRPGANDSQRERGREAAAWLREHAHEEAVVAEGKVIEWRKVEA